MTGRRVFSGGVRQDSRDLGFQKRDLGRPAAHLKITRANLSRMIHGKTGVSAEMALRLSEAFGTSP